MSTLVELITAIAFSVFGITAEEPPITTAEVVVFECCELEQEPSSDMHILKNISSIKIEHNRTENKLL